MVLCPRGDNIQSRDRTVSFTSYSPLPARNDSARGSVCVTAAFGDVAPITRARCFVRQSIAQRAGRASMLYEKRALDVKFLRWDVCYFCDPKSRHSQIARWIIYRALSAIIRPSFANSRSFAYRLNETMFFDNLPLEITCSKCGKQINETVKWLKAESRNCPFCGTLIDTTEFRRGIDEATNRTHEMLQNLQESLRSIKIRIKV
jgi:hypothetical protein